MANTPKLKIIGWGASGALPDNWDPTNPSTGDTPYLVDTLWLENHDAMPTGLSAADNLVSISYNLANGTFYDRLLCAKRKIIMKFDCIDEYSLNKLYYSPVDEENEPHYGGILGIIKKLDRRFFRIEADPAWVLREMDLKYMIDGIYYLGTPTTFEMIGTAGTRFYSGELHFIEVSGTKLAGSYHAVLTSAISPQYAGSTLNIYLTVTPTTGINTIYLTSSNDNIAQTSASTTIDSQGNASTSILFPSDSAAGKATINVRIKSPTGPSILSFTVENLGPAE